MFSMTCRAGHTFIGKYNSSINFVSNPQLRWGGTTSKKIASNLNNHTFNNFIENLISKH